MCIVHQRINMYSNSTHSSTSRSLSILAAFFVTITILLETVRGKTDFAVVGYMPEWRFGGIDWDSICPFLTDLLLFSVEVDNEGNLVQLDRLPDDKQMANIRAISSKHKTNLLISFGGFGRSNGFPVVVQNDQLRAKFIDNIINNLVLKYNLDGIDLNWEYPSNIQEWIGLFKLIKQLKYKFTLLQSRINNNENSGNDNYNDNDNDNGNDSNNKNKRNSKELLLSMAFYPGQERVFNSDHAKQYLLLDNIDYFHMMSYDNMGNTRGRGQSSKSKHSTLEFGKSTVYNAIDTAFEGDYKKKLTMGVPFYARHMRTGDWKTYEEIVKTVKENEGNKKENGMMGFENLDEWNDYYYNGVEMIKKKTQFAFKKEIGGIMIWEAGQDVDTSDKQFSLFVAIHNVTEKYRNQHKQEL